MCESEQRQANAIIAEIEFGIGNWDQARHISRRELAERIYGEFAGCGRPVIRAKNGEISAIVYSRKQNGSITARFA